MVNNKDEHTPTPGPNVPHLAREDVSHHLDEQRAAHASEHPPLVLPTSDPPEPPRVLFGGRLAEQAPTPLVVPARRLKAQTRRDFLIYGAGVAAAAAGFWWLLPEDAQQRPLSAAHRMRLDSLEARFGLSPARSAARKEALLGRALTFDDDVAEALFSPRRLVPVYDKSLALSPAKLRNNYNSAPDTPDELFPDYVGEWTLTLSGLASGREETLRMSDIGALQRRLGRHEQVTRLVCVEGWSAIAWWAGLRFADFLAAYPPAPGMKWANLWSDVNIGTDDDNNLTADPYYVSIDLGTARHPQTLLATHQSGAPLTIPHGAPLRLIAPMKLGLKNIKAITGITYTAHQPEDYWNERGYSKYDGL